MGACSFGDVGESVEPGAVAGDLECLDARGVSPVRWGIGGDGCGKLLGREMQRGAEKRGDGEEVMESHG